MALPVLVLLPTYDAPTSETEASLRGCHGIRVLRSSGVSNVTHHRNLIAQRAYEELTRPPGAGLEFVLWLDGDMAFRREDVAAICIEVRELAEQGLHPLVGAPYPSRTRPGTVAARPVYRGRSWHTNTGELRECAAFGLGFAACSVADFLTFIDSAPKVRELTSDGGLCERAVIAESRAVPRALLERRRTWEAPPEPWEADDDSICYRWRGLQESPDAFGGQGVCVLSAAARPLHRIPRLEACGEMLEPDE